MPATKAELLQGTLDLLILRTLVAGPMHGYSIAQRIQERSQDVLVVEEGSLYPCLYRMEEKSWITAQCPANRLELMSINTITFAEPMIRLRNVEKSFQTKVGFTYVLRQINLDIAEGDFLTIMGPSGAGKSTLLGILGLYDHAWEGEYRLLGHAVHRLPAKERAMLNKRYVGFVFQQFHLLDDLTVAENLDMPLSYRNIPKSERQAAVADVLDRFNIVGKKDLFPTQLSGGQQQLVAVARAIIALPKLLLADEPTGNLHTDQGREIMELFKKLNQQGTTIVQVTHNEAWAAYGRQIIRLKDGWMEK
jgi:ABC-type lipoprotein export system ATPase subunit